MGHLAIHFLKAFLEEHSLQVPKDLQSISVTHLLDCWLKFITKNRDVHFHTRNRVIQHLDGLVPGFKSLAIMPWRNKHVHRSDLAIYINGSTALNPNINQDQRNLCREILESLPREKLLASSVRAVIGIAHGLPVDRSVFIAMDHTELRALGGGMRAFGHLDCAKKQRHWDPHGRYSSHLCRVSRTIIDAHPALWNFPVRLASALARLVPDVSDRSHVVLLASAVADSRVLALPKREAVRIRSAVVDDICMIVRCLYDCEPVQSIRQLLPFVCLRTHLLDLCARVQARVNQRRTERSLSADPDYTNQRVIVFFNGAIQRGLFEPSVRTTATIAERELVPRMQQLEALDPRRWQSLAPQTSVRDDEFLHRVCRIMATFLDSNRRRSGGYFAIQSFTACQISCGRTPFVHHWVAGIRHCPYETEQCLGRRSFPVENNLGGGGEIF